MVFYHTRRKVSLGQRPDQRPGVQENKRIELTKLNSNVEWPLCVNNLYDVDKDWCTILHKGLNWIFIELSPGIVTCTRNCIVIIKVHSKPKIISMTSVTLNIDLDLQYKNLISLY